MLNKQDKILSKEIVGGGQLENSSYIDRLLKDAIF